MTINQCQGMRESDVSTAAAGGGGAGGEGEGDVHMIDVEVKAVEAIDVSRVKRKRGRPPRIQGKQQQQQQQQQPHDDDEAEDVCFICFDGGSLVLCDRRGCPKAYHPACIKRDESFFKSKAKWNCGWHICSSCQKASHYMCYTCTYSLCKGCAGNADYVCVRGNKGLCGTCMRTIMLIENVALGNTETVQVDFDDKTSWEYLFKIYWVFLKAKLSLTVDELNAARNPWKGDELPKAKNSWKVFGSTVTAKEVQVCSGELDHGTDEKGPCLDNCYGNVETNHSRRRKIKDQILNEQNSLVTVQSIADKVAPYPEGTTWATKELLEFISHMRNGDTSMVSQFDAQALLLEYIKRNNLRDPWQKSQIICDSRLLNLFGKPRVGHFEMLKLLEYHFLIKEQSPANDSIRVGVADVIGSQMEAAESSNSQMIMGNNRRRKTRKKMDERGPQINLNPDEYAAIDVHNINLLYLKRNLMENLMDESEKFHEKVVRSFVRIRISGSDQKQDMYRLVQVVGTSKTAESYNIGSKTTDIMLEILNLNKKETVSIDGISNQEFSEDECRRLRQSIKCGLIKRLKVGEIQEKALALQPVKVNDLLEAEIARLNHLRDRASEKGHRKNLREFVEKLDILNSPMERQRRLLEIPKIHMDQNMDPNYESDEEAGESAEIKQGDNMKPSHSSFGRKGLEVHSSPREGDQNVGNREQKNSATTSEQNRNLSTNIYVDMGGNAQVPERVNEFKWSQGVGTCKLNNHSISKNQLDLVGLVTSNHSGESARSESFMALSWRDLSLRDSEMEKLWHYQDPYGKVQGPFAMMQLRKWSTSRLFPPDLRVWRIGKKQDDSILLTDALISQCPKVPLQPCNGHLLPRETVAASNAPDKKLEYGFNLSTGATSVDSKKSDHDVKLVHNDSDVNVGNELASTNLGVHSSTCTKPLDVATTSDGQVQSSLQRPESSNDGRLYDTPLAQPSEERKDEKCSSHPSNASGKLHKTTESQTTIREIDEKRVDSEGRSSQLTGQNWRPQPFDNSSSGWNSNTGCVSMVKSSEKSDLNHEIVVSDHPNRTPKQSLEVLKGQAENELSISSNAPVAGSGKLPEVAGDWGDYSSVSAKHCTEIWDLNLAYAASLKSGEGASDHTTPTSVTDKLTNSSPPHPAIDTSSWQPLVPEPNEFCSLVDESVSDLLAEVEAMESLGGPPSPTSRMSCHGELTPGSDDDCFSPIETFSSALDPGKRDAFSSSCDVQMPAQLTAANVLLRLSLMPSQPTIADEPLVQMSTNLTLTDKSHHRSQMPPHSIVPDESCQASHMSSRSSLSEESVGLWQTDNFKSQKSFSGHSSSTVNQVKAGSEIQASSLSTVSQCEASSNTQHPALSTTDAQWGTRNLSINSDQGGVSQGNVNMIWGSGHGSNQHQASTTSAFSTTNSDGWRNQRRYSGDNKFSDQ